MNAYEELQARQQKEVNEFPCFFAFSTDQFNEGMKSLGLKPSDTKKVYRAPGGMFYSRTDSPRLKELLDRHDRERQEAIEGDTTGEEYIFQMFRTELANHEYGYTYELDETLDAVGITREQVRNSKNLFNGLKKALKRYHVDIAEEV